jgi:hypothetical protein
VVNRPAPHFVDDTGGKDVDQAVGEDNPSHTDVAVERRVEDVDEGRDHLGCCVFAGAGTRGQVHDAAEVGAPFAGA